MAFIIFGKSSCIICAVVRSTLLLLSVFILHSLFPRSSALCSLQYFDGFYHISDKSSCIIFAVVRSTLLLWHFSSAFFVFFVVPLCPCNILMAFYHIRQ